jgi:CO/xanthine dehydrogenase FAD-binding subunit
VQAFAYARAHSVTEAVALLQQEGQARLLAGGTDLIVGLREQRVHTPLVVDVKAIPELSELAFDPANGLQIGAAVPCHRIYNDAAIAAAYPGLIDAVKLIGGVQIQGRASLGGNLCNASPAADSIPTLIAHAAVCLIAGPQGERRLPVEEFCTAPGKTALQPGELLVALHLPRPAPGFGAAYLRFTPRNEMDIAVVGAGVALQLAADGATVTAARIALGAVAPTPLYAPEAGAALVGRPLTNATIAEAVELARAAARPIDDMRGTARYRRHLAGVLTQRVLAIAQRRAADSMERNAGSE